MRSKLLRIVTWLVVVIVLCVAIGVTLLRVFVFTGGEQGHISVVTDTAIAVAEAQPDINTYARTDPRSSRGRDVCGGRKTDIDARSKEYSSRWTYNVIARAQVRHNLR